MSEEKEWSFEDKDLPKRRRGRRSEYRSIIELVLEHRIFKQKGRVMLDFPAKTQGTVYSGLMSAIKDLELSEKVYVKQKKDEGIWLVNPEIVPKP